MLHKKKIKQKKPKHVSHSSVLLCGEGSVIFADSLLICMCKNKPAAYCILLLIREVTIHINHLIININMHNY